MLKPLRRQLINQSSRKERPGSEDVRVPRPTPSSDHALSCGICCSLPFIYPTYEVALNVNTLQWQLNATGQGPSICIRYNGFWVRKSTLMKDVFSKQRVNCLAEHSVFTDWRRNQLTKHMSNNLLPICTKNKLITWPNNKVTSFYTKLQNR